MVVLTVWILINFVTQLPFVTQPPCVTQSHFVTGTFLRWDKLRLGYNVCRNWSKLNVHIGILSLTVSRNNWLSRYILCLSVTSFRNKVSNFSQPNCTRLVKVVLNWVGCTVVLWRISRVIFRYVFGSVKRCLRCLWKLWKASMCKDVVKLSSK